MKTGGGMLRERLRFERRSDVDESHGATDGDWFPHCTVAARIKPLNGNETLLEGRLSGIVSYELTVRKSTATSLIREYWRAVDTRNGTTFNLKSIVNPDERGRYLIFTAQSGGADG